MRIEILLKEIRNKRRTKFRAIIKNDRDFKFASKLYRKERENAYTYYNCNDSTSTEYRSGRAV